MAGQNRSIDQLFDKYFLHGTPGQHLGIVAGATALVLLLIGGTVMGVQALGRRDPEVPAATQDVSAQAVIPEPAVLETEFVPWPEDGAIEGFIPGQGVVSAGTVNASVFVFGTAFGADGTATGSDLFEADQLTFSCAIGTQGNDRTHSASVRLTAPQGISEESDEFSVGWGGRMKCTINEPASGWGAGVWSITVVLDGEDVKTVSIESVLDGSSARLKRPTDDMGFSGASQRWAISGYMPDYLGDVHALRWIHDPLAATAAHAYFSDDGTVIYTGYPAVLSATDGSLVWEGAEPDDGTIALEGNGIYGVSYDTFDLDGALQYPFQRIWPNPATFSSLDSALAGAAVHEYQDWGLGWSYETGDFSAGVRRLRPEDTWQIVAIESDPTGRYRLYLERPLTAVPGERDEKQLGEWQWMVYDSQSEQIVSERLATEVGMEVSGSEGADSVNMGGDNFIEHERVKVFSDGSFIAGTRYVAVDRTADCDIVGPNVRIQNIGLVEGRPSMVWLKVQSSMKGAESGYIIYDTVANKRFPLPEGNYRIESASRDGKTLLLSTEQELIAWGLEL